MVAVSADKSMTLPMVSIDSLVVVVTETLPESSTVPAGTEFGPYKSVLIVPSPDTESKDIVNPNPSTVNDLSLAETLEYDGAGSVPTGSNPPGGKNLLASVGIQSSVTQVNDSNITPNDGIVPTGID